MILQDEYFGEFIEILYCGHLVDQLLVQFLDLYICTRKMHICIIHTLSYAHTGTYLLPDILQVLTGCHRATSDIPVFHDSSLICHLFGQCASVSLTQSTVQGNRFIR